MTKWFEYRGWSYRVIRRGNGHRRPISHSVEAVKDRSWLYSDRYYLEGSRAKAIEEIKAKIDQLEEGR
jgi:hypothetical protein